MAQKFSLARSSSKNSHKWMMFLYRGLLLASFDLIISISSSTGVCKNQIEKKTVSLNKVCFYWYQHQKHLEMKMACFVFERIAKRSKKKSNFLATSYYKLSQYNNTSIIWTASEREGQPNQTASQFPAALKSCLARADFNFFNKSICMYSVRYVPKIRFFFQPVLSTTVQCFIPY